MKKLVLLILVLMHGMGSCSLMAQTQPNTQTVFDFLSSPVSLALNPHARAPVLNNEVTVSGGATKGRVTGVDKIKKLASHTCTTAGVGSYCQYTLKAPNPDDADNMCDFGFIYKGNAIYHAVVIDGVQEFQLGSRPSYGPGIVSMRCGDAAKTLRFQQISAGTAAAVEIGVVAHVSTRIGTITPPDFSAKVSSSGVLSDIVGPQYFNGTSFPATDTSLFTIALKNLRSAPNCTVAVVNPSGTDSVVAKLSTVETTTAVVVRTGNGNFVKSAQGFTLSCNLTGQDAAAQQVASVDSQDYGPRPYTPIFTGFGTVSNVDCTEAKINVYNVIDCKFSAGTSTAVEARVSLPGSNISAALSQSPKSTGSWYKGVTDTAHGGSVLRESNVGYLTFSTNQVYGNGSANALSKANGNTIVTSGDVISFTAWVPIQGWGVAGGLVNIDVPIQNPIRITATGAGTYTPSSNAKWAIVEQCGAGGGGGGGGTTDVSAATTGGSTVFGTATSGGGGAGARAGFGGSGGSNTITGYQIVYAVDGGRGNPGTLQASSATTATPSISGGMGGSSSFGGAGAGGRGTGADAGLNGATNSGGGGGGAGTGTLNSSATGGGGGAGGCARFIVPNLSGPISYSIGAGGTGQAAGTGGAAGGNGGSGFITIIEQFSSFNSYLAGDAIGRTPSAVTTFGSGRDRTIRGILINNGTTCSMSTFPGESTPGAWGSGTRNGAGRCSIQINSGVFASTPVCNCNPFATGAGGCVIDDAVSVSATQYGFRTSQANVETDKNATITCIGARP